VRFTQPSHVLYLVVGLAIGLFLNMSLEKNNLPIASATPARAWQMIVISATTDPAAFQQWLARRGVESRVTEIVFAAELSEADVEAVAERDIVLEIRAPLPGEYIPKPPSMWQWLPIVQADGDAP